MKKARPIQRQPSANDGKTILRRIAVVFLPALVGSLACGGQGRGAVMSRTGWILPAPLLIAIEDRSGGVSSALSSASRGKATHAQARTGKPSQISVYNQGIAGLAPIEDANVPPEAMIVPERADLTPRADLLSRVPKIYAAIVKEVARDEGVDINLILAIMLAENAGFDPAAISPAGAIGLMQIMPATGREFGASDLTDPEQNIRAAGRFLRELVKKYGNLVLIASAYNAGEPQVDISTSLPLVRETADFVTKVVGYYTNVRSPMFPSDAQVREGGTRELAASDRASNNRMTRKARKATRISSSMLIYSAHPLERQHLGRTMNAGSDPAGPVQIEKER